MRKGRKAPTMLSDWLILLESDWSGPVTPVGDPILARCRPKREHLVLSQQRKAVLRHGAWADDRLRSRLLGARCVQFLEGLQVVGGKLKRPGIGSDGLIDFAGLLEDQSEHRVALRDIRADFTGFFTKAERMADPSVLECDNG